MKKILLAFLLLIALPTWAHECWIACQKFIFQVGETAQISLHVGENFEPTQWKGKIKNFTYYAGRVSRNILPALDTAKSTLACTLASEGTQLFSLQSYPKFIRLGADKFNAYLEEDGLKDVLKFRQENGQMQTEGTELYERCNKMLVQVGKKTTHAHKQILGLPLEIICLDNPYTKPENMRVKVLFQGKPLPSHRIKVWHREADKTTLQDLETDTKGQLSFSLQKSGKYMVSSVKMVQNTESEKAKWRSYWANFTFGVE